MYDVTPGAVYWQLRDAGGTKKRNDHRRYLPWRVKAEHTHARPATMLRFLSRREQGETLPEAKDRMLTKWLAEVKEADVVVCYRREQGPNPASPNGGFYYSKRRPSDGDNLIRVDDGEADDTSKVPLPSTPRTV
ncbi:hypothetical protein ABZ725_41785 [Streptomyces sp. NPDC006872]|uniref:hypothetical protein n=1 Tax=Streptomyces sp. NPDC006872 TaxID=3155720 RepID=UPI0033F6767B